MSLLVWRGRTSLFLGSDSGTLVGGDRVRLTDIFYGPVNTCYASQPPRGAFGTSSYIMSGLDRSGYVVNQSTVNPSRGNIGKLTIEWEAGGSSATSPLPAGDFDCSPQELNPKIERSPYFSGISYQSIQLVYAALYAETQTGSGNAYTQLNNITDATQLNLAQKLLAKLLNGMETYYLAGWRYTYTTYSYTVPTLSRGGVPGTPGGPLSGHLPSGVSWLRLADKITPAGVNGSMFKTDVTWLGGPSGHWDTDVYS